VADNDARYDQNACFADGLYLYPELMPCVIQNFNLTDEEADQVRNNFPSFNNYNDAMVAAKFDDIPVNCEFTNQSWMDTEHVQKEFLTGWFSKQGRDLHISRIFRRPLAIMQDKVDQHSEKE